MCIDIKYNNYFLYKFYNIFSENFVKKVREVFKKGHF